MKRICHLFYGDFSYLKLFHTWEYPFKRNLLQIFINRSVKARGNKQKKMLRCPWMKNATCFKFDFCSKIVLRKCCNKIKPTWLCCRDFATLFCYYSMISSWSLCNIVLLLQYDSLVVLVQHCFAIAAWFPRGLCATMFCYYSMVSSSSLCCTA